MRGKRKELLFFAIAVLFVFLVWYMNTQKKVEENPLEPEVVIEQFLEEKAKLYEDKEELQKDMGESLENISKNMDEKEFKKVEKKAHVLLKGVRETLTQEEYQRLLKNQYILNKQWIEGPYNRCKIEEMKYTSTLKEEEKVSYIVTYIEKVYVEGEKKEEKRQYSKAFTLEKIEGKWLISSIQ